MARLGIDFGTTNTVVVAGDRGRYPVVPHLTETGAGAVIRDVFPSLMAYDREARKWLFGAAAERALLSPDASGRMTAVPSLKRRLRDYAEGARVEVEGLDGGAEMLGLLTDYASAVRDSVRRSGVLPAGDPLEAVLSWPANANGAQRYVTRRAFRDAGFTLVGTVGEPVAAAVEYADRLVHGHRTEARRLNLSVGIFDLGGGTFDASVVNVHGADYTVLAAGGVESLGGDDFDEVLASLFASRLGVERNLLNNWSKTMLLTQARREKERLGSGAVRSLTLDPEDLGLTGSPVRVSVAAYEAALAERLAPALAALHEVLAAAQASGGAPPVKSLYLVGGSCRLPVVARLLAKAFPDVALVATDKPFTATAMGAAIRAGERMIVREVFARHFGVLRLAECGARDVFTPVFPAGTRLPAAGEAPLVRSVSYAPRHNIGRLRFLECAGVDGAGMPAEGLRAWSEMHFPYDPAVSPTVRLDDAPIVARDDLAGENITETYACDADGIITVRVTRADGACRIAEIFRN